MDLIPLERPADALFWGQRPADDSEFSPEDPLALAYLAQQVGLWLLPTLTTRTSRAWYYAVVLYGLHLSEQALQTYGLPDRDDRRVELFERWERFWALAVLESRNGQLGASDPDGMRGIRGAKRAWAPGDAPLQLDFNLIARQSELGGLGAYLSSLRLIGLVLPGTVRPAPAAIEIIERFWDAPEHRSRAGGFEAYALSALDPKTVRLPRRFDGLTLAGAGKRARLTAISDRPDLQQRLHQLLMAERTDALSQRWMECIESAAGASVRAPREVISATIAGRFGEISPALRDHLEFARLFGDLFRALLGRFDALYDCARRAGWIALRSHVAQTALAGAEAQVLRVACGALLQHPLAAKMARLPAHGAALLQLARTLTDASPDQLLERLVGYHHRVQRDRSRGSGWIRVEGERVIVDLATYGADPDGVTFPTFKIDVVQSLLRDLGKTK
jgi:hypothetical protein